MNFVLKKSKEKTGEVKNSIKKNKKKKKKKRKFKSEVYPGLVQHPMGLLVTLVDPFQPLTNVTKNSILDVAWVLDMPLKIRTT